MKLQQLGKTAFKVPPVGLGTYTLASTWPLDLDLAKAALRRGLESGLMFMDSAHVYGAAENILGEVFADEIRTQRDRLILCSKGGLVYHENQNIAFSTNSRPEFLRYSLKESLRRLGTDYLDVYLVHWFDPEVPISEVADAMRSLKDEGLARSIGVSNYTIPQMDEFRKRTPIEVIQVAYSLFSRAIEGGVLGYAKTHDIGVMGHSTLAQGYLTGTFAKEPAFAKDDWRSVATGEFAGERYRARIAAAAELAAFARKKDCTLAELAIAWVVSGEIPVVPLVGVQAPQHVDAILRAANIRLTGEEISALRSIAAKAPEVDYAGLVT